jgi:Domain of unknown function (DUF4412)
MKIAIAVFALLELVVSVSRADFIMRWLGEKEGQTFELTIEQTDINLRADFLDYSLIQSIDSDESKGLLNSAHLYFKFSTLKMFDRVIKGNGSSGAGEFESTGKTQIINGYETREFKAVWGNAKLDVFVTDDVPPEKALERTMHNWLSSRSVTAFKGLLAAGKVPGWPIRFVLENLGMKIVLTFESIEEAKVAESEFVVPDDYTEVPFLESLIPGLSGG